MSNWHHKSNYSFDAANNLLKNGLFNPSVHSSYYACVQYVYHVMEAFWGEDITTIELGGYALKPPQTAHVWLKKEIFKSMKAINKTDAVHFRDEMDDLSGIRVKADYLHEIVNEDEARDCNKRALELVLLLQKHYDI